MPFTTEQTRLAVMIDTHVTQGLANGGSDAALLQSLVDHMGPFKWFISYAEAQGPIPQQLAGAARFAHTTHETSIPVGAV